MITSFLTVVSGVLNIPIEQLNEQTGPATLGEWTSLKHIQLVAALEDAYDVRFSPREVRSVRTVGGFHDLLSSKGIAS
jgi:acyl carrier protein